MRQALVSALVSSIALLAMGSVSCRHASSRHQAAPKVSASMASAASAVPSASSDPSSIRAPLSPEAAARAACRYGRGAMPSETLDRDMPRGDRIPIDHFVILVQENRSFDHYFQSLGRSDVDVAPLSYQNPDPSGEGQFLRPYLLDDLCLDDVPHNVIAVHHQVAGGQMNGFVAAANPGGRRALGYYDGGALNYYHWLANTFALGDRYFASVPGPTYPNRMFLLSGWSHNHTKNEPLRGLDAEESLFHQLAEKKLSFTVYSDAGTFEEALFPTFHRENPGRFRTLAHFAADAKSGKLPSLSWVSSTYGGADATDEHAPANVQLGQAFVAKIVSAVVNGPAWPRTALILTFDEHGGFFDHVPPPRACLPFARATPWPMPFDPFRELGVRVPVIVVSPYAKPGYVSHHVYSHTSILRLLQARFDLPAFTSRDANEVPLYDLFDFTRPRLTTVPEAPKPAIDPRERARCRLKWAKK
jgi:phospholipase C